MNTHTYICRIIYIIYLKLFILNNFKPREKQQKQYMNNYDIHLDSTTSNISPHFLSIYLHTRFPLNYVKVRDIMTLPPPTTSVPWSSEQRHSLKLKYYHTQEI